MEIPILRTKLHIPQLRSELVSRPYLLEKLDEGLKCRLTLISSPAGFGKTTLLSQWVRHKGLPTGWITLNKDDNDFPRFLSYLITALQNVSPAVEPDALELLHAPQPPPIQAVLTVLLNQIDHIPFDFLLILDDYHLIEQAGIHQAVETLLKHMPPQMHMVIVSRGDPPIQLARLRGQGQLVELRLGDLRFSAEDCANFFTKSLDKPLSVSDLQRLLERTEGWVTGLQMAAISIQGRKDISGFIQSFSGSHRYILDYLIEEVLEKQSDDVRDFLIQTSILEQFTGALCNTITDRDDAVEILDYLEKSNLFIVPLDDHRQWYRYHRLFADLLQARLRETSPDLVPGLHERAGIWYQENGYISSAVDHALAAGKHQRAIALIKDVAEKMLMRSESSSLMAWRKKLPADLIPKYPNLAFVFLWAQAIQEYRFEEIQAALDRLENEDALLPGRKATLLAFIEISKFEIGNAEPYARQALDDLDEGDSYFRSFALWIYGLIQAINNNLHESIQVFEDLYRLSQNQHNLMFAMLTACQMARAQMHLGRLAESEKIYLKALAAGKNRHGGYLPIAGEALMGLGDLYREQNLLDQATDHLLEGIELTKMWRDVAALEGYLYLARVKQAQDDWPAAEDALDKAMAMAVKYDATDIDDRMVEIGQARLWLATGDVASVEALAAKLDIQNSADLDSWKDQTPVEFHFKIRESVILTRLCLKQEKYSEALAWIDRQLGAFKTLGRKESLVEVYLLQAETYQALGNSGEALQSLNQALAIAEPAGYLRIFLDQGPPIQKLLERSSRTPYVNQLITLFRTTQEKHPLDPETLSDPKNISDPQYLIDPLSERELEILRLLPTNLTTPEIAQRLFISVSTVRSHIKSIYSKLNVHRRSEAVNHADELGLL